MVEDGFAVRKIAEKLNTTSEEIIKVVELNKFLLKLEPFTDASKSHIIGLYKAGVSAKALGIKYGIGKRKVQNWAKEIGILRDRNASHRMHFCNEHIFDIIDTPEKAYWLGFLYADAYNEQTYNHSISLNLKSSDIDHMYKIFK